MGRKKNISGEALNVPALGSPGSPRHVEPGETIDVPDELAGSSWPAELWEDITDAKPKTISGKSGGDQ